MSTGPTVAELHEWLQAITLQSTPADTRQLTAYLQSHWEETRFGPLDVVLPDHVTRVTLTLNIYTSSHLDPDNAPSRPGSAQNADYHRELVAVQSTPGHTRDMFPLAAVAYPRRVEGSSSSGLSANAGSRSYHREVAPALQWRPHPRRPHLAVDPDG